MLKNGVVCLILLLFVISAGCSKQPSDVEPIEDKEVIMDEVVENNVEKSMQEEPILKFDSLKEIYISTYSVDPERVSDPIVADLTNDGNDEIVYFNEVYPTDTDKTDNFFAIYSHDFAVIGEVFEENIFYCEVIKNKLYGNVLVLHSVTPSGSSYSKIVAFLEGAFTQIGEIEAHRSEYEYVRNGDSDDIVTKHFDFESDKSMADPDGYYEVIYYWDEEAKTYQLAKVE